MAVRHRVERFQFSSPSNAPFGEVMAGAPEGRPAIRSVSIGSSRCGIGIDRRPAALPSAAGMGRQNQVVVDGAPTAAQLAAAQKALRSAKPESLAFDDLTTKFFGAQQLGRSGPGPWPASGLGTRAGGPTLCSSDQ
jgi:hypothetical protein